MPQFLIQSSDITDNKYVIKDEDYYHLTKARRIKTGELIDLRGDNGSNYRGRISEITNECIIIDVISENSKKELSLEVSLYISLLKGKKFDFVLQKATEIGVSRIIPVLAERSIPVISFSETKKKRWEKIVSEAFKQCIREHIPVVEELLTFKEAVFNDRSQNKIIAHPDESSTKLKKYLAEKKKSREVSVLIGPEGGFSDKELELAHENNWDQVVFGVTSLRAETAAIVLPAILIYEWSSISENKSQR